MNNSYTIKNENLTFRRANINDDFEQIAKLIYDTNPYIYPFWFHNDLEEAINFLKDNIKEDKFIYNYNNIYIAYDEEKKQIIGILCALDKSIDLNFDYSKMEQINKNYAYTINHYIKEIIKEVEANDYIYISNICIDGNNRGKKIGTSLASYFIGQMEDYGYEEFTLDCLVHDLRAKNLFHKLKFNEMGEKIGFDGTDNSKVEMVTMKRKKGEYLPTDYKNFI